MVCYLVLLRFRPVALGNEKRADCHIMAIVKALWRWCRACGKACGKSCLVTKPEAKSDEESAGSKQDASSEREFIVVEFNAWECAGSDVLWAAVITKIFDAVSRYLGSVFVSSVLVKRLYGFAQEP